MNKCTIAIVVAHPDDEAFTAAVALHEAVRRGHKAVAQYATYGEAGKTGRMGKMSRDQLIEQRKKELNQAADIIGIEEIQYLGYPDGKLDEVNREVLTQAVVDFLNTCKAEIVLTFPEDGLSGHRDHTAIHHAVNAAVEGGQCRYVQKLYYFGGPVLIGAGHIPSVVIDTKLHPEVKRKSLVAFESQVLSVERVFGDLRQPGALVLPAMAYERFILKWKRGDLFPAIHESFLTDDLI
ncbi:hypothetical protein SY83_15775 [Paenibacillus swuensis]|uniref:GlcNAc-PI de-N-acetylase n=1 Tax=Paenibacillus swuensis TaxID=1178515 RepID=A0A172TKC9_9BACL|nr:PIG-L family deacetylase [Paenibacillus swuensis]ANE47498.1 hypothetical protein SY83_15775 [Paenibacillus swuensis]